MIGYTIFSQSCLDYILCIHKYFATYGLLFFEARRVSGGSILKSIEARLQGKPSKRLIGDMSFLLQ